MDCSGSINIDTLKEHPRYSKYKYTGKLIEDQQNRRNAIIQDRKDRFNNKSRLRRMPDLKPQDIEMDSAKLPHFSQLMMNEWMLERPPDLVTDWLAIPCPYGKRCLVVARKGSTRVFHRNGRFLLSFHSSLPGGGPQFTHSDCILDCIFGGGVLYILDCMQWGDMSLYETDYEFRVDWIASKFQDNSIRAESPTFSVLRCYPCDDDSMRSLLCQYSVEDCDGVIFIHKLAPYTVGMSPLSCWLKLPMLPDILNIV